MNDKREMLAVPSGPRVSVKSTLRSGRLKETNRYLKSNETACIVNQAELDICITQRGIYRMLIIMLIMRQMDLSSVYM